MSNGLMNFVVKPSLHLGLLFCKPLLLRQAGFFLVLGLQAAAGAGAAEITDDWLAVQAGEQARMMHMLTCMVSKLSKCSWRLPPAYVLYKS